MWTFTTYSVLFSVTLMTGSALIQERESTGQLNSTSPEGILTHVEEIYNNSEDPSVTLNATKIRSTLNYLSDRFRNLWNSRELYKNDNQTFTLDDETELEETRSMPYVTIPEKKKNKPIKKYRPQTDSRMKVDKNYKDLENLAILAKNKLDRYEKIKSELNRKQEQADKKTANNTSTKSEKNRLLTERTINIYFFTSRGIGIIILAALYFFIEWRRGIEAHLIGNDIPVQRMFD